MALVIGQALHVPEPHWSGTPRASTCLLPIGPALHVAEPHWLGGGAVVAGPEHALVIAPALHLPEPHARQARLRRSPHRRPRLEEPLVPLQ